MKTTVLKCRFCDETFERWSLWDTHEQNVHERNGPLVQKKLEESKKFCCFFCNELWHDGVSLNLHIRKEHGYCRRYGKIINNSISEDSLRCDHCSLTFNVASKKSLLRHLTDIHFTYKSDSHCHICKKILANVECLKKHIEKQHSVIYKCQICLKTFTTNSLLKYHIKNSHKFLKCMNCAKSFRSQKGFIMHVENQTCKSKAKTAKVKETQETKVRNVRLLEILRKSMKRGEHLSYLQTCKFEGK